MSKWGGGEEKANDASMKAPVYLTGPFIKPITTNLVISCRNYYSKIRHSNEYMYPKYFSAH
jgi:hypothetical protein